MAKGGDIVALGHALRDRIAAIRADLPAGITLSRVQDQPAAVSKSVGEFVSVLVEAVVVVLLVSFIALGLHTQPGLGMLSIDIWPGMVVRPSRSRWCWRSPSSRCSTGASACTRSRSAR